VFAAEVLSECSWSAHQKISGRMWSGAGALAAAFGDFDLLAALARGGLAAGIAMALAVFAG